MIPFYLALTFIVVHQHQRRLGRMFSYSEGVDLAWIQALATGIAGFWLLISIPDALNLHFRVFEEQGLVQMGFGLFWLKTTRGLPE